MGPETGPSLRELGSSTLMYHKTAFIQFCRRF